VTTPDEFAALPVKDQAAALVLEADAAIATGGMSNYEVGLWALRALAVLRMVANLPRL
jgi:spore coat polysaccharide biosynthesis predicted glycosyltransferase SpsG